MRVALISDLHGNPTALDAVLSEIDREGVDQIVCLGDVPIGPHPVETLERVSELGCPVIMGNWDAWLLDGLPRLDGDVGRKLIDQAEWVASQLSLEYRTMMRCYRATHTVALGDDVSALCFHGSPRSFNDSVAPAIDDAELQAMLEGYEAAVLVGGHTHFQFVRPYQTSIFINPGSLGLPFQNVPAGHATRISPWAEYGFVSLKDGRLAVELRRTAYDVERYLQSARFSGMPHAEWWVECWATGFALVAGSGAAEWA